MKSLLWCAFRRYRAVGGKTAAANYVTHREMQCCLDLFLTHPLIGLLPFYVILYCTCFCFTHGAPREENSAQTFDTCAQLFLAPLVPTNWTQRSCSLIESAFSLIGCPEDDSKTPHHITVVSAQPPPISSRAVVHLPTTLAPSYCLMPSFAFAPTVQLRVRAAHRTQATPKTCARACASTAPTAGATAGQPTVHTRFSVASLAGDGIGPEVMGVAERALSAAATLHGATVDYERALVGGAALDATNQPLPARTLEICKASDAALLACIGGPRWDGGARDKRPESGLLALRSGLGVFANLRPAAAHAALGGASSLREEALKDVDIMVVRELVGGIYFGKPSGVETKNGERMAYNTMVYTESEIRRIARVAFEVARSRGRRVCSVDKANVLDVSQLWRDVVMETAKEYADVQLSHMYVDNAAMQLVRCPAQFDVILTSNLFGDILSDAAAMVVGSLGMLPSGALGEAGGPALFEPVHGSAPDIAGRDAANPSATVLSAAMMCRYGFGRADIAESLENAVATAINDGFRTADIMDGGCTLVGCSTMGDKILERINKVSQ